MEVSTTPAVQAQLVVRDGVTCFQVGESANLEHVCGNLRGKEMEDMEGVGRGREGKGGEGRGGKGGREGGREGQGGGREGRGGGGGREGGRGERGGREGGREGEVERLLDPH